MNSIQHRPAVESGPEVEAQPCHVAHRPQIEAQMFFRTFSAVPVRLRIVIAQVNAVIM